MVSLVQMTNIKFLHLNKQSNRKQIVCSEMEPQQNEFILYLTEVQSSIKNYLLMVNLSNLPIDKWVSTHRDI